MLNKKYVDDLIKSKGLKRGYIAEQMGWKATTATRKLHGLSAMTYLEAERLFEIFGITDPAEKSKFFCL